MRDKPHGIPVLGLELTDSTLRGAELTQRQGKPCLQNIFDISIDQENSTSDHVKPLYNDDEQQLFYQLADQSLVVTGLNTHEIVTRPLEIQLTSMSKIDSVLDFQTEPLLPYHVDSAIIDRVKLSSTTEGSSFTITATQESSVKDHLKPWHSIRIEPEIISCVPAALAAFSNTFGSKNSSFFVLHVGLSQSTCILVKNGQLLASQLISAGSNDPELFRMHCSKTFLALGKGSVSEVLLTGEPCSNITLNKEYKIILPQKSEEFPLTSSQLQSYAIPIGLGLTALPGYRDQINFRQKNQAYPYPWKRVKTPLIAYLFLSVLISFVFYLFGNVYLSDRLDSIKHEYSQLLMILHKPYTEFEKTYQNKVEGRKVGEEIVENPIHYTQNDLLGRLNFLEKDVSSIPDIFPLVPNVPRVSDVLAWLSSHPHVKGVDEKDGLHLKSFSYKMVKRPDQNKKRDKYQVRVDLEFTAPNPTYAREFHDFLLAPNDLIDPKQEIKWSTSRGKYVTSFFLKDKTIYP